jgi:tetrahydromethanopterin S-methyltransferase subunit G
MTTPITPVELAPINSTDLVDINDIRFRLNLITRKLNELISRLNEVDSRVDDLEELP